MVVLVVTVVTATYHDVIIVVHGEAVAKGRWRPPRLGVIDGQATKDTPQEAGCSSQVKAVKRRIGSVPRRRGRLW